MAPDKIKQWITNQDGIENLKLVTAEMPQPKEGEALVRINTVSLNYRDTEVIMGLYGHHASLAQTPQIVPCSDICGTIVSSTTSTWKEGQRVMAIFNQTHLTGQIREADMSSGLGLPRPGCLTEYRVFPSTGLVAVPDYLSDKEACCLPIASVTAWMALNGFRPHGQPYENCEGRESVVLQGTGGVAIAGLQIAHAAGMKTIVTSSSDAKLARARDELGADATINYRSTPAWHEAVLQHTGGSGADIIFENGGALTLRKSFDCVAFGGLINCIGYLSGKNDAGDDRMNTNVLALKRNVTLKGILNGPRERFEEMVAFYEKYRIRPVVDRVFGFEEAREGVAYLFGGAHFGKVVVRVA